MGKVKKVALSLGVSDEHDKGRGDENTITVTIRMSENGIRDIREAKSDFCNRYPDSTAMNRVVSTIDACNIATLVLAEAVVALLPESESSRSKIRFVDAPLDEEIPLELVIEKRGRIL